MVAVSFFVGVALIFGVMFDAIEFLPNIVAVVSALAVISAICFIIASGLNTVLLGMGLMGSLGLLYSRSDKEE